MGKVKVALAGIGNNSSALVQGVHYYRAFQARHAEAEVPGIRRHAIDGLGVGDLEFVTAFDVAASKVGKDLSEAIFATPNNYPRLEVQVPDGEGAVQPGITEVGEADEEIARIAGALAESGAEVLVYALPRGDNGPPRLMARQRYEAAPPTSTPLQSWWRAIPS